MDFRLFISHSSPTEESKERLRELTAKIHAAAAPQTPVQVLVDEEQIRFALRTLDGIISEVEGTL